MKCLTLKEYQQMNQSLPRFQQGPHEPRGGTLYVMGELTTITDDGYDYYTPASP